MPVNKNPNAHIWVTENVNYFHKYEQHLKKKDFRERTQWIIIQAWLLRCLKAASELGVSGERAAELGLMKLCWCDDAGIMKPFLMLVLVLQQWWNWKGLGKMWNFIKVDLKRKKLMHENSVSFFTARLYLWGRCPTEKALYWTRAWGLCPIR